ncbi:MAG: C69 family dipeptidase [Clostridiaceae bacterium]|nr:C69 family dipeptidase [Clostridiaceae bacterium]
MFSCDMIALGRDFFACKHNLLGKNSDRPLGEAQPLAFFPSAVYTPGTLLRCTHLTVPQAERTYAVLGSKPFWIWGFEMGANECGVFIGNEAQGSRCVAETEDGMLGMDMLRIALERAATARDAIYVIAALLTQYGQNANANLLFDRRYENSYMIVDRQEIWLMETAGREWVAKLVSDWTAISNCYSIGTDYDLCSREVERHARENRWLAQNEPFDFARTYTAPAPRQTYSIPRRRRLQQLIREHDGALDYKAVKRLFRDHFEGDFLAPQYGACYGGFVSVCMHAMTWDVSQTAASLICSYDEQLGIVCRYAPSLPCCSVFIPVYWTGVLPAVMKTGGESYDAASLWWVTERLAMAISVDEKRFGLPARTALQTLEEQIEKNAQQAENQARSLLTEHKVVEANAVLNSVTEHAAKEMLELASRLSNEICSIVHEEGGAYGLRKEFLIAYSNRVKMPLF